MKHILYFTRQMHAYAGKILYVNLLGMVLISFLDGLGLFLIVPLLSISGIWNMNAGILSRLPLLDALKAMPVPQALLILLGAYLLLNFGQSLLQRNLTIRDTRIHTGFINYMRLETYRAMLQANWQFFIRKRKSDLITALTEELARVMNGTYLFLQFMASLVFTLIQVGIALWLSAKLTLFVLCCGIVISFFSRHFIRKSKAAGSQTSELARSYMGGITDQLNGIKDIKSNMLEASRIRWLEDWSERIGGERLEHTRIRMNSQLCYKLAASVIIGCFIYFSVVSFRMQGEQVLLIVLIFSRLWPRFIGIQANLQQIAAAVPAFTALRELQKECFDATEISGGGAAEHDVKPLQIASGIECRNLSFRYEGSAGAYALRGIQLHIRPKEMTAIVGPSGAGKSTLVDILMGLLQPESGQVMIDGQPLTGRNLLSLRRSIGYVPQDPLLFNGTIRDNLLMMEPHATEEELYEALHFAAAGEFVARLPQGLDTMIGDRGIRLSGGERQRLVLARAILRKPSILVLDEATSALDMENEAKIQEALDRLKGHMTLIIIAHRPSTIRNADQVITLEQGRLAGITQAGKEGTAGAETPQSARVVG